MDRNENLGQRIKAILILNIFFKELERDWSIDIKNKICTDTFK